MKLYKDISISELNDISVEGVNNLISYFLMHIEGDKIDYRRAILYISENICKLPIKKIELLFEVESFHKVIYLLINEDQYISNRDVPIFLDILLRHAYSKSDLVSLVCSNCYEKVSINKEVYALLFLASHCSEDTVYKYRDIIINLLLTNFHLLSTNQLNRLFDTRNTPMNKILRELYDDLFKKNNIKIFLRLYILSQAFFPERVKSIKREMMILLKFNPMLIDGLSFEEQNLVYLLKDNILKKRFSSPPPFHFNIEQNKIKVAICVSGQLRGYKKAFPSWIKSLNLESIDYTFFVSVWDTIGGKQSGDFLYRYIPGELAKEIHDFIATYGRKEFELLFKNLFSLISINNDLVSKGELSEFYSTDYVKVESDSIFDVKTSNMQRMCYKIEDAYCMAINSGQEFDLYVRIRPDKYLEVFKEGINWPQILLRCNQGILLCDFEPRVKIHQSIAVGDQMQIATKSVADIAFRPYSTNMFLNKMGSVFGFVKPFTPHNCISMPCLATGIQMERIEGLVLSDRHLLNAIQQLSDKEIRSALRRDYEETKDSRVKLILDFYMKLLKS